MISITICGHNSHHNKLCNIEHLNGYSDYLLLFVKTKAWFYVENKKVFTEPNMAILFNKNTPIHYGCDTPDYNDDWIHFQITEEEKNLLSSLLIPFNQPIYNIDIYSLSQYVGLLTNNYYSQVIYKNEILASLMRSILFLLASEVIKSKDTNHTHKYYSSFSKLRSNLYNNPGKDWSVIYVCNKMELSISYFQHLYNQFFKTSFQKDIIFARIEYAKFYLKSSNMSIHNLSEFCGYHNELHFMRQFKKCEGMTPSEYRKKYSI